MVLHPNLEVQVPAVPVVLPHLEVPCDLLALLGRDVVPEVEHSLLPVSGAGVGAGGEHHLVVAVGELDIAAAAAPALLLFATPPSGHQKSDN